MPELAVNELPPYDATDGPTGCCARFHAEQWQEVVLHLDAMPFVHASTMSFLHLPVNMDSTFTRTLGAIEQAHARTGSYLVLTHHRSAWHDDHLFAVDRVVAGAEMTNLSGTFVTKVFDGPYSDERRWHDELITYAESGGHDVEDVYWYYTTCPGCAKAYGHNYVVGLAQVA